MKKYTCYYCGANHNPRCQVPISMILMCEGCGLYFYSLKMWDVKC
jgi:transcription elongation factor Elf1